MTIVEGVIIVAVVAIAAAIVVLKAIKPFGKARGTCRGCGPTCSCESKAKDS